MAGYRPAALRNQQEPSPSEEPGDILSIMGIRLAANVASATRPHTLPAGVLTGVETVCFPLSGKHEHLHLGAPCHRVECEGALAGGSRDGRVASDRLLGSGH